MANDNELEITWKGTSISGNMGMYPSMRGTKAPARAAIDFSNVTYVYFLVSRNLLKTAVKVGTLETINSIIGSGREDISVLNFAIKCDTYAAATSIATIIMSRYADKLIGDAVDSTWFNVDGAIVSADVSFAMAIYESVDVAAELVTFDG